MNIIKGLLNKDQLSMIASYMLIALHIVLMTGLIWLCKWAMTIIFELGG